MKYEKLDLASAGSVATITLRAGDGNLIDERLLLEIQAAAAEISESDQIRVVVVAASGADFCRGWHPSFLEGIQSQAGGWPGGWPTDPFGPLAGLAAPVVAAVQGRAISAGLELALTADIRLAEAAASFCLPDVPEGRTPLAGGTQRLPRVAGRGVALAMLLTGEELDAGAALSAGLVTALAPRGELNETTDRLAQRLASVGPLATRFAKEAMARGFDMPLADGLRLENDLALLLQSTGDRAEGVKAFFERRPARFEGR